jgi:hypothetical protein
VRVQHLSTVVDKKANRCKGFWAMSALADGTYDVIVVDAQEIGEDVVAIDCAVSSGPHRGEVVSLRASHLNRNWFDLLAAPGTLTVIEGEPQLALD